MWQPNRPQWIVIVIGVGLAAWCLVQFALGSSFGATPPTPAGQNVPADFYSVKYVGLAFVILVATALVLLRFERAREQQARRANKRRR